MQSNRQEMGISITNLQDLRFILMFWLKTGQKIHCFKTRISGLNRLRRKQGELKENLEMRTFYMKSEETKATDL